MCHEFTALKIRQNTQITPPFSRMEEVKHVLNYYVEFEVPLMLGGLKLAPLWHAGIARFKSERPVLTLKEGGLEGSLGLPPSPFLL